MRSAVSTGESRMIRAVLSSTTGTRSRPFSVLTITATTPSMNAIRICGRSPSPKTTMKNG